MIDAPTMPRSPTRSPEQLQHCCFQANPPGDKKIHNNFCNPLPVGLPSLLLVAFLGSRPGGQCLRAELIGLLRLLTHHHVI